jgi:hypothetical protein
MRSTAFWKQLEREVFFLRSVAGEQLEQEAFFLRSMASWEVVEREVFFLRRRPQLV